MTFFSQAVFLTGILRIPPRTVASLSCPSFLPPLTSSLHPCLVTSNSTFCLRVHTSFHHHQYASVVVSSSPLHRYSRCLCLRRLPPLQIRRSCIRLPGSSIWRSSAITECSSCPSFSTLWFASCLRLPPALSWTKQLLIILTGMALDLFLHYVPSWLDPFFSGF